MVVFLLGADACVCVLCVCVCALILLYVTMGEIEVRFLLVCVLGQLCSTVPLCAVVAPYLGGRRSKTYHG